MLGKLPTDILAWESFSNDWAIDAKEELKLEDLRILHADYGQIPDLNDVNAKSDVVFAYNGTTSGVKVPNLDWLAKDRGEAITICDATSAVFAMDIDYSKLDVITFSWQKVLGSEAAHGILILSPKAVNRLETYQAPRSLPKVFRLTKKGKLIKGIFSGATINTPSMLAVEDVLDSLNWVESIGGEKAMIKRSQANLAAIDKWQAASSWANFLADKQETISNSSICLKIDDADFKKLDSETQQEFVKSMLKILEQEQVAFDIASYRDAPTGIRIWGGGTVESKDVEILTSWLDYAFDETKQKYLNQNAA